MKACRDSVSVGSAETYKETLLACLSYLYWRAAELRQVLLDSDICVVNKAHPQAVYEAGQGQKAEHAHECCGLVHTKILSTALHYQSLL